jgi:predicted phage tail protein
MTRRGQVERAEGLGKPPCLRNWDSWARAAVLIGVLNETAGALTTKAAIWRKPAIAAGARLIVAGTMRVILLIVGAAFMLWGVWGFISGLSTVAPTDAGTEPRSRADGTWFG